MSDALRLVVVGGYGTFGQRIVGLLGDQPKLTIIVAGRSLERARECCSRSKDTKAEVLAAVFDRDGDLGSQLATLNPDIIIDASGPFQAYGDRCYRLVEAAIEQGVNYLDLADGADFVAGITALDEPARGKGLYVLSGVSSCPVLTAAAAHRLSEGMTRVTAIRGGIAPSPRAEVGGSVLRAIASYAGRSIKLVRNGTTEIGHPFTEHLRFTIAPPGCLPLNTSLFSLVDVPDLRMLAMLWPEVRDIWIGAALAPEIHHRALGTLAWLVRLRLVRNLAPLVPLLDWTRRTMRWGEHRGGMFVEVEGVDNAGSAVRRSWHLVAEGNDGPYIPAMGVAAVVSKVLDHRLPEPGARPAFADVELADYERFFAKRAIVTGIRDKAPSVAAPLYARVMNSAWHDLPTEIRAMHDVVKTAVAEGRATVERGQGWLARLAGAIIGFPPASPDVPVSVRFDVSDGVETWTRTFGDRSFHSVQFAGQSPGLICERFGPLIFAMVLVLREGRLSLIPIKWRAFGISLPMLFCPRSTAYEAVEDGYFRFHVEIGHPWTGLIVRYRGWLVPRGIPLAGQMP